MTRVVRARYVDPLDAIWLSVARGFGLEVRRSGEVYASTDGAGVLTLGTAETLDADDCLAQMIFHEICHACVQGPRSHGVPDWGLDNETSVDVVREHACLRLQAELAGRHGLRRVFAPTTDYREFYDALPLDPMDGGGPDVELARQALARAGTPPYEAAFRVGLSASRAVVRAVVDVEATFGSAHPDGLFAGYGEGAAPSATPASSTTGAAATPKRERT